MPGESPTHAAGVPAGVPARRFGLGTKFRNPAQ
jgi:hypothetical protein